MIAFYETEVTLIKKVLKQKFSVFIFLSFDILSSFTVSYLILKIFHFCLMYSYHQDPGFSKSISMTVVNLKQRLHPSH